MGLKVIRDKEMGPKEKRASAYEAIVLHAIIVKLLHKEELVFPASRRDLKQYEGSEIFTLPAIMLSLPGVRVLLFPPTNLTRCKRLGI